MDVGDFGSSHEVYALFKRTHKRNDTLNRVLVGYYVNNKIGQRIRFYYKPSFWERTKMRIHGWKWVDAE